MDGPDASLKTDLAGVPLRCPVLLAAGTAGYVDEMAEATDMRFVGAVVSKSITRESREGNPPWRILPVSGGMLNAIGLANVGAERFASEYGPRVGQAGAPVIGSIAGSSVDDYVAVARMFAGIEAIPAVEVNVSCPNVKSGRSFGDDPGALREVVGAVREALGGKRLMVKMPPIITSAQGHDIVALAGAAIDAGADVLCIANTIPAMQIDADSRMPTLANVTGGLSGPAAHPVVVRLIHTAYRGVAREAGVPVVGIGGVVGWRSAAEMILAGAAAVGVGTALFAEPRVPKQICDGLAKWVRRQGARSIGELVGAIQVPEAT